MKRGWLSIGLVVGTACALAAPHLGVPFFLYPLFGWALCAWMLRWQGLKFGDIGLDRATWRWNSALLGSVLGLAYGLANFALIGPVIAAVTGTLPDLSGFAFVRNSLGSYFFMLAASWIIGGLYEETLFRGFVFGMLRRHLPTCRGHALLAFAVSSLLFAAYHWQLGLFGMLNALVICVPLGLLQRRFPRNLEALIGFHACADMVAFTLIRLGYLHA